MNRFFLLALIAGLLSPKAAKSESYKLFVKVHYLDSVSTSVLTMISKETCVEGKRRILQKSEWDGDDFGNKSSIAAICIKSE